MKRTLAASLGLLAFVSTLALATSEAEAQRYGGARVAGGYRGGYRGGVVRGPAYGGGIYGPRYGGFYGRGYGGYRGYGGFYGRGYGGYYGGYYGTRVYGGYYGGVYAPRVYVTGPVLAPPYPVYVAPAAPLAIAPPPPPVAVYAPAPIIATRPPEAVWGLGVRGLFVGESASKAGGIGGHLRLRGGRWLGLELSADYVSVDVQKTSRQDVPVMAALLVYLTPGRLAPYLLAGAGVNFANAKFANGLTDSAQQIAAQFGGGLELRIGRHLGVNADIRYIYRERLGSAPETVVVKNIGTEHGAQIVVGGTWYF